MIFGNEQADRMAKRALELPNIERIKIPINDMMNMVKKSIYNEWSRQWQINNRFKIKDRILNWSSSYRKNRLEEIILARLRLNCIKSIHLIPRIENRVQPYCTCNNRRITLKHIIFECRQYMIQRHDIIHVLNRDNKELTVKNILSDNIEYCDIIIKFMRTINYINKI